MGDTPLTLDEPDIRECLEGVIPSTVATCAADGTPNITYVSQAHYVDATHVALSYQFFNKTRQNILANPRAAVAVLNPFTGGRYQMDVEYLRTETAGPLFEGMKAKLAGIASHTGMSGVFRLLGADVYRVLAIETVAAGDRSAARDGRRVLTALRAVCSRIAQSQDLSSLLDDVLESLEARLGITHAMVLLLDGEGRRLYTVASRGYAQSGVGSEIALGCGVIGVAAEQRTPIRISHMTADYSYGRAVRESLERAGMAGQLETAIPLPGLPHSRSQLAVPIVSGAHTYGVLYVESPDDLRFGYDDEDALALVATQMAVAMKGLADPGLDAAADATATVPAAGAAVAAAGQPTAIRHYPVDDSIFAGSDYLIKGVAGAILATILREHLATGRTEFTNRELRLHPGIALPEISDNLEARLVLLQRRLASRPLPLQIEKAGRGRFRLVVSAPLTIVEMPGARGQTQGSAYT
jgi:adenylate cyclase